MNKKLKFITTCAFLTAIAFTGFQCTNDRTTANVLPAETLPTANLAVTGPDGMKITAVTDNDIETVWTSSGPQTEGMGITIDMGKTLIVNRIWISSGKDVSKFPRSLRVLAGDTPENLKTVAEELCYAGGDAKIKDLFQWFSWHQDSNLKFPPVICRYLKIEIGANTAGYPWSIAELEIGGLEKMVPMEKWASIAIDKDASDTIKLAANELQYYLTAMGTPALVVNGTDPVNLKGPQFRLVNPPAEKPPYAEMDPVDLEDVSVRHDGDTIVFDGKTPRAVLYGIYEFLYRQGVRWLYPDAHGEYVPLKKSIDLSILPISYRPPFSTRFANFSLSMPEETKTEDGFMWYIRNHFNCTQGSLVKTLGGAPTRMNVGYGYAHNLQGNIIPNEILKDNPDFACHYKKRGLPMWSQIPCTSNENVVKYVADRFLELEKKNPSFQGYGLHPLDVSVWCECEKCAKVLEPITIDNYSTGFKDNPNYSELYFKFMKDIDHKLGDSLPSNKFISALAYADHNQPPAKIAKLPDNMFVDVCQYWIHSLPVSSPQNAEMKRRMEAWAKKCSHLGVWDYVLLHVDGPLKKRFRLLCPLVSGICDEYKFFKEIGVRHIGTQASDHFRENPWNYYAYARAAWNPDEPTEQIKKDFFRGYYLESAEPMQEFYQKLEDCFVASGRKFSAPFFGYNSFVPGIIPFDVLAKMETDLLKAESLAKRWFIKERVAAARDCYEGTLEEAGFLMSDLKSPSSFKTIQGGGPEIPVAPKDCRIASSASSRWQEPNGLRMCGNGRMGDFYNFRQEDEITVKVTARGSFCKGGWPKMDLRIGGKVSDPVSVESEDWKEYVFKMSPASVGIWETSVEFINCDHLSVEGKGITEHRDLWLKEIRIVPPVDTK